MHDPVYPDPIRYPGDLHEDDLPDPELADLIDSDAAPIHLLRTDECHYELLQPRLVESEEDSDTDEDDSSREGEFDADRRRGEQYRG